MNSIFVTRSLPGDGIERLRAVGDVTLWPEERPPSESELLVAAPGNVEALVTTVSDQVNPRLLDACPSLRMVANVAVGYDNIDVDTCTERGIVVTNTPGVLTEATADIAFGLIIAACRRFKEGTASVVDGGWGHWNPTWMCGKELFGATLGIIGLGAIGRAVARRAHAFGMDVVHHSRHGGMLLHELLSTSDVVSVHCPLNPDTRHLIGTAEFATMKQDAVLVNTARGAIVDEAALYKALSTRQIGAAGLDVTTIEPLDPTSPLLKLPNCYVLPHIGSATLVTRRRMADLATELVIAFFSGDQLSHVVNPQVLTERPARTEP